MFTVAIAVAASVGTMTTREAGFTVSPRRYLQGWDGILVAAERQSRSDELAVVVLFTDYECRACAGAARDLEAFIRKNSADMQIVIRHLHRGSYGPGEVAARAALCAAEQNRFNSMHRLMFKKIDEISLWRLEEFAIRANVPDRLVFASCMNGETARERVAGHVRQAQLIGITTVPTALINGNEFVGRANIRVAMGAYIRKGQ